MPNVSASFHSMFQPLLDTSGLRRDTREGEAIRPVVGPCADLAVGSHAVTEVADHRRLWHSREAVCPVVRPRRRRRRSRLREVRHAGDEHLGRLPRLDHLSEDPEGTSAAVGAAERLALPDVDVRQKRVVRRDCVQHCQLVAARRGLALDRVGECHFVAARRSQRLDQPGGRRLLAGQLGRLSWVRTPCERYGITAGNSSSPDGMPAESGIPFSSTGPLQPGVDT